MGCGDRCRSSPRKSYLDWDLDDPRDVDVGQVRALRDGIERRLEPLVRGLDSEGATRSTSIPMD